MKKVIFGIFAHPDDEAFGPSGTLLLETRDGTELHLITLTAGENGMNPDNHTYLRAVRLGEWRAAGNLMGATSMRHLGYTDGELGNNAFLEIVERLETIIRERGDKNVEVEIMSMDLNGISGHIDHIVAARAASFVFYRLKAEGWPVSRLRLACIPRPLAPKVDTKFVYMEPGRQRAEITETIDARCVVDKVYAIMRCHRTQRDDGEMHIKQSGEMVAVNYFIVKT